jgi:hypothetical protein
MLKLIEKLRSKPSDRNIRIIRIIFALILLGVIYFGFQKTTWNWPQIPTHALYVLYSFPIIGLIRGIWDPGVFRKKIWKWTQVSLGVIMMIMSIFFIETHTDSETITASSTVSGEQGISALDLATHVTTTKSVIDTDFWVGFFGFWLAMGGLLLASKNITTKNERYGEKVTKIRV